MQDNKHEKKRIKETGLIKLDTNTLQSIVEFVGAEGAKSLSLLSNPWHQLVLSRAWKSFIRAQLPIWFDILQFAHFLRVFEPIPRDPEWYTLYVEAESSEPNPGSNPVTIKYELGLPQHSVRGVLDEKAIQDPTFPKALDAPGRNEALARFILELEKNNILSALLKEFYIPESYNIHLALFHILSQLKKQGYEDPYQKLWVMLRYPIIGLNAAQAYYWFSEPWLRAQLTSAERNAPCRMGYIFHPIYEHFDNYYYFKLCFSITVINTLIWIILIALALSGISLGLIIPPTAAYLVSILGPPIITTLSGCIIGFLHQLSHVIPPSTIQRKAKIYEKMVINPKSLEEKAQILIEEIQRTRGILENKLETLEAERRRTFGLHTLFYSSARSKAKKSCIQAQLKKLKEIEALNDPEKFIDFKEDLLSEKTLNQRRSMIGIGFSDTYNQLIASC